MHVWNHEVYQDGTNTSGLSNEASRPLEIEAEVEVDDLSLR